MLNILYVHGIATRGTASKATCETIRAKLLNRPEIGEFQVVDCNWSQTQAARLPEFPSSLPGWEDEVLYGEPEEGDKIWAILELAPLAEVEEYAEKPSARSISHAPVFQKRWQELTVSQSNEIESVIQPLSLCVPELVAAWDQLERFSPFKKLAERHSISKPLADILARAVIAQSLLIRQESFRATPVSYADRTQAAEALAKLLLYAQEMGPQDLILGLISRIATPVIRSKRFRIMSALVPFIGDVLFYQAHGETIRDGIRNTVENQKGDVVLIGHSLGGVACVDLLLGETCQSKVSKLITVGSQAGFFREIGVLESLRRAEKPSATLPPWLNIYDQNDFLSFLAAPVFRDLSSPIADREVSSGARFPKAHSAYWDLDDTWTAATRHINTNFINDR